MVQYNNLLFDLYVYFYNMVNFNKNNDHIKLMDSNLNVILKQNNYIKEKNGTIFYNIDNPILSEISSEIESKITN